MTHNAADTLTDLNLLLPIRQKELKEAQENMQGHVESCDEGKVRQRETEQDEANRRRK